MSTCIKIWHAYTKKIVKILNICIVFGLMRKENKNVDRETMHDKINYILHLITWFETGVFP